LSTLDESASNEELDGFNVDWMGKYKGQSRVVVKPKNTQEVADVMKYCYEQGIAIVPQGGNTGLVGTFTISVFYHSLLGTPGISSG
jgi:FAD/FMN-containing dehydrogenase